MIIFSIFFVTILIICDCQSVLELNQSNFQKTISNTEHILVQFYAPWCGHCQKLGPQYEEAAKKLYDEGSDIKLAKVDATQEAALAQKHGVQGYPTLKFFRKGSPMKYDGERRADQIVNWLKKKAGLGAKVLVTVADAKSYIANNSIVVVGFFSGESQAKEYLKVADTNDEFIFAIAYDSAVKKEFGVIKDSIIMFTSFDEGKVLYDGEFDASSINKFCAMNSIPLLVDYKHETFGRIFGKDIKQHLFLFISKNAGYHEKFVESLKPIAKKHRSNILFTTVNVDELFTTMLLQQFGFDKQKVPGVRITIFDGKERSKYKPDFSGVDPDQVDKFVQAYLNGKVNHYLLTQPLPQNWNKKPVKVLVGTNYDEFVMNPKKDVMVLFYAPWSDNCKKFYPVFDQLGEHYKNSKTVVIAKMDATLNELNNKKIKMFPQLRFHRRHNKQPILYQGPADFQKVLNYIESNIDKEEGKQKDEKEEGQGSKLIIENKKKAPKMEL